jgi:3-deoxy-D-manno-octulosonic-acid transferase
MFLYNLSIQLLNFGINISSIFKPKAKLWVNGRKNWEENLKLNVKNLQLQNSVWIHCASLGEFEQGRPVIQKIREENPLQKIVLTF